MLLVGQHVEQHRRTAAVDVHVTLDLVHRLTHAHRSGQVKDHALALDGSCTCVLVPHVAQYLFAFGSQVGGPLTPLAQPAVHLRFQIVKDPNSVSSVQQSIHQVGANKARTARDQNLIAQCATPIV